MKHAPTADTQSPWYEAFTPAEAMPAPRWLPGPEAPAPADQAPQRAASNADDQWATEALFDYYNG